MVYHAPYKEKLCNRISPIIMTIFELAQRVRKYRDRQYLDRRVDELYTAVQADPRQRFLVNLVINWIAHDNTRSAAVIAFYTLFALSPILFLGVVLPSELLGAEQTQQILTNQLSYWVTPEGAAVLQMILDNTAFPFNNLFATLFSVFLLLYASSRVFAELHFAFNKILENQPVTSEEQFWTFIRRYTVSVLIVIGIFAMILLAVLAEIIMENFGVRVGNLFGIEIDLVRFIGQVISPFLTLFVMFILFWVLPDVPIPAKRFWPGVITTALLFEVGRIVIGVYLNTSIIMSAYGAASSVIIVLIWVFYSVQILLLGAEISGYSEHSLILENTN